MPKIISQIVEVCVFRIVDKNPQFLLLQRSSKEKLYPNLWQIITGTIISGEKSLDAVYRELNEETGLVIKKIWNLPIVDSYLDLSNDAVHIVPTFAVETYVDIEVRLSEEHKGYEWLDYKSAADRIVWPGQKRIIEVVNEYIIGGKSAADLLVIKK